MATSDRTQRYNYIFTWNCPDSLNESDFIEFIEENLFPFMSQDCGEGKTFSEFQMQFERGEDEGRLHVQGRFHLNSKRTKPTMLEYFRSIINYYNIERGLNEDDFDEIDAWSDAYKNLTIKPEINKLASKAYVTKDCSRVPDTEPMCYPPLPPKYRGSDLRVIEESMRPWQSDVLSIIDGPPHDRTIYWLYDAVGGTGKSKFFKWLQFKRGNSIGEISDAGTASQLKQTSYNLGPRNTYICDLPRVKGDNLADVFRTIETIKNGKLVSTMYGGAEPILFDPPHVFICSNFLPNLEHLSKDRWKIYEITEDFTLKDITLSLICAINNIQSSQK